MCVSLCVHVCARVVSFWVCVCVCVYAFCSQPLCGKQSLWRALAFHNQSLAPLHTPPPLPRIQTWTHTALVSFGQLIPNFVCCLFIYFLLIGLLCASLVSQTMISFRGILLLLAAVKHC